MIGQKGVPATHGGVERHVEELGARLSAMGHEVVVFTRPAYTPRDLTEHRGMRLVSVPTIASKHLDAIVHSFLCTLRTWAGGFDVVHYHAIGPTLTAPLARLRGRKVVATVHGQDWRRGKWGALASAALRAGEWTALHVPQATIVVSGTLADAYRAAGARRVVHIPNGVSIDPGEDPAILEELGLTDRGYILFAGRLVPEKGLHHLLTAYRSAGVGMPLVVAGDSSASDGYVATVKAEAGPGVVFAGYVYGARLATLFRHCALFVLPSDLEGLPIVLLEALAYGAPVLASDIAPNVEVLGADGAYFRAGDPADLARALAEALADLPASLERALALRDRVVQEYDWDVVARRTDEVYRDVTGRRTDEGTREAHGPRGE